MPSDFWMRTVQEAEAGRLNEAIASARVRQRMRPRDPEACELLGMLLLQANEPAQAAHQLQRACELEPGSALLQLRRSDALMRANRSAEGIAAMRVAIALDPAHEEAWLSLTAALILTGDVANAARAATEGLAHHPDSASLASNRAIALARAGETDAALAALESFLVGHPQAHELRSNMLLMLQYSERAPDTILQAHRAFGASLPAPQPPPPRRPATPLRIGVLSADLRGHSVGFFVEPLLAHAPDTVELVVFSNSPYQGADPTRERLRALARTWHDVHAIDDAALDALIRRERIDVLLELNGHTSDNRLPALARKPAPLLVTAIGYPDTTGVPAIDLRLVDSITDPPGSDASCTERLLRLDPCFLCYSPPREAVEPSMPAESIPVTFGSFNNVAKLVPGTVALWARVLQAMPRSRLLLKSIGLEDAAVRDAVRRRFASAGIDDARLELRDARLHRDAHLALYGQVHVALDPTPYNGTTTTCEALWMGVPVVTLQGARHAARVSSSLLQAAGFGAWIARDAEQFVRIATELAMDRARLVSLRDSMRDTLRASPLLDARAYATRLCTSLAHLYSSLP
jgi:predicted O-linked N-acetylglucosamine transferase (SPINDLY family)